jgi:hypothetical protein
MANDDVRVSISSLSNDIIIGITEQCASKKREKVYFFSNTNAQDLVNKIQDALKQLENVKKGVCVQCGNNLYPTDKYFKLPGEAMIHKHCLIDFMQTPNFSNIKEPLKELEIE